MRHFPNCLPLAFLFLLLNQCGGTSVDSTEASAAGAAGQSSDAGLDGAGGSADASADCKPFGSGGGDPQPVPLDCNKNVPSVFQVSATVGASTVDVKVHWCGSCEWNCSNYGHTTDLKLEPATSWAQVTGIDTPCGTEMIVHLLPNPDISEGDLRLTGTFSGRNQCSEPVSCPIDSDYRVTFGDAGATVKLLP